MKRLLMMSVLSIVAVAMVTGVSAKSYFKTGERAPTFSLNALNGESVSLDSYKGKVIVLGLFHICEPCMIQGSNLQKVYESTRGKNVAVIGVNSSGDSKNNVSEFLSQFPVKVTYPYLLDPGKSTDKLYGGGRFIPNVYIIDQNGVIQWQRVGNMDLAGADVILAEVEKLLANAPKGSSGL
jgi:cytochrome c biogenesis protein CcmG, thiol:disulfide interchange protein DsbE